MIVFFGVIFIRGYYDDSIHFSEFLEDFGLFLVFPEVIKKKIKRRVCLYPEPNHKKTVLPRITYLLPTFQVRVPLSIKALGNTLLPLLPTSVFTNKNRVKKRYRKKKGNIAPECLFGGNRGNKSECHPSASSLLSQNRDYFQQIDEVINEVIKSNKSGINFLFPASIALLSQNKHTRTRKLEINLKKDFTNEKKGIQCFYLLEIILSNMKQLSPTEEALRCLRKQKKAIQGAKNPLGHYSRAQAFELIKINDKIREYKRVV